MGYLFFLTDFLFKDFIYLFLERGERRERNINLWTGPATRACVLMGNLTFHFAGRHSVHWATPGRARRAKLLMHVINLFIQQLLTFCIRFNQVKDLTRRPLSSIKFWIYVIFLFLCKEEIKFHLVHTTNQRLNTLSVADSQGVDGWGCQGSAPFPNINRLNGSCAVSAQCVPRPLLNAWHPSDCCLCSLSPLLPSGHGFAVYVYHPQREFVTFCSPVACVHLLPLVGSGFWGVWVSTLLSSGCWDYSRVPFLYISSCSLKRCRVRLQTCTDYLLSVFGKLQWAHYPHHLPSWDSCDNKTLFLNQSWILAY